MPLDAGECITELYMGDGMLQQHRAMAVSFSSCLLCPSFVYWYARIDDHQ